uniref:WWE domain-containing protein n=1 Tax=Strongyloides papillosus TaxID=174720 RepID=A0A0N5B6C0_STREA
MPFEYCEYSRKNYSTQSSQTLVKDVEGIVITDNDVPEKNRHHKRGGADKIAIQEDVVDELYDVIPGKWLYITEDDTDDIEDKKSKIFLSIYYTFID